MVANAGKPGRKTRRVDSMKGTALVPEMGEINKCRVTEYSSDNELMDKAFEWGNRISKEKGISKVGLKKCLEKVRNKKDD